MNKHTHNIAARQRGLTLVELMVALVVGLLLIGGVGSIYLSSKRSNDVRAGLSAIQENGRLALSQLQAGITPAGFPLIGNVEPLIIAGGSIARPAGIEETADGAGNGSDTITIAFEGAALTGAANLIDCAGGAGGGTMISSFYVNNNQLICRAGSSPGTEQAVASGIDNMQVLYGVDDDGNGVANRYLRATDAAGSLMNIVSVQVALLVNGGRNVNETNSSQTFMVLDRPVTTNDRRSRRVFTTTVPFRNRIPL